MRQTNFERQQKAQAKQQKDALKVASVHFTRLSPNVYNRAQINDGDPSTYYNGSWQGAGPANPNWFRYKTERAVSEKEMHNEIYQADKAAKAAQAKKAGYPSYEAMQKAKREAEYKARLERERMHMQLERLRIERRKKGLPENPFQATEAERQQFMRDVLGR